MASCFEVSFTNVAAVVNAEKHFPPRTPKRWYLIAKCVQKLSAAQGSSKKCGSGSPGTTQQLAAKVKKATMVLGQEQRGIPTKFEYSADHCKQLFKLLSSSYSEILSLAADYETIIFSDPSTSAFKPLILLSTVESCCGRPIYIKNRSAHPVVYTTEGTLIAAAFAGNCSLCHTTYHTSYYETKDSQQHFHVVDDKQLYFQTSSQTVFEIKLMRQLTAQLTFSACSFESQAEVYNSVHGVSDQHRLATFASHFRQSNIRGCADGNDWQLNVIRLEDGWFVYRLVHEFTGLGILGDVDFGCYTSGSRRNVELLCQRAMMVISVSPPKWIHHCCNVPGCREGMVTIDGNEKLTRAMCTAPKSKVKCPVNHINLVQCCTQSPITGGRHQQSSKFCSGHSHLATTHDAATTTLSLTVRIPRRTIQNPLFNLANMGTLPDTDSSELFTGCRKESRTDRFFDRTAGVAAAVRPCGVVVNFTEMFTCESPTQMYVFLVFTFGHGRDIDRLKYVAYDRACDLHPFLCNLEHKGTYFAQFLLKHVKFLVDRFHVSKHTEPCCKPPSSDNPQCRYHPDHADFCAVKDANTECAEQSFRWLNKYKTIVRNMKQYRFNFFLYTIIDLHNRYREQQLRQRGLM